ncbi:uncharacterized protein LOC144437539 [Glandiceps talaboti]
MPLDTILCLDTSGSMAGRGMRELKKAVENFIHGVQETASECNLKENVGVVEFGRNERIVQPLTNDYSKVKRAAGSLEAGGRTPMTNGLLKALQEIIEHGGVVKVAGKPLAPRIILMTDGVPTDDKGESDEAKMQVLKTAAVFGPVGFKEVGLPHSIPIACVGCGDCDPELLGAVAKLTNGMFVQVDNVEELSTFFKRQVLLIRFAAKFADDMEQLTSLLVLREFMKALGEAVEEAEAEAMLGMLLGMMGMGGEGNREVKGQPPLGSRVRRGKDWKWKDQDKHGVGTVIEHDKEGWVHVEWDHGDDNKYRWGAEDAHDVKIVDEQRVLKPGEDIKVGVRVQRGKDWKWDDQDGGVGNIGFIYKVHSGPHKGLVQVRWPNGTKADYRHGKDGFYDLKVVSSTGGASEPTTMAATSGPEVVEITDGDDNGFEVMESRNLLAIAPASRKPIGGIQVLPTAKPMVSHKTKESKNMAILAGTMGGQVIGWRWKDDSNQWRMFDENVAKQLEDTYKKNQHGSIAIKVGEYSYQFNLSAMNQVNQGTNRSRQIQREAMDKEEYDLLLAIEKSLFL